MRIKKPIYVLFTIALLFATGTPGYALPEGTTLQYTAQLETHSDKDSPDDYVHNILSLTRHLQGAVFGTLFYMHKYNLETDQTGGQAAGASISYRFSKNSTGMFGYTYTENRVDSTRLFESDRDRFSLGYNRALRQTSSSAFLLDLAYNTQTDWAEGQTISPGFTYRKQLNNHWTLKLKAAFTYAMGNIDANVYNQWQAKLSYALCDKMDLYVGFLFVDKTYTYPTSAIQPDDDSVFRLGITYK